MTITEAARRVLEKSGKPMTVDEILEMITTEGLFDFRAKDARSVLRKQLRRHTDGVSQTDTAYFVLDSAGRFFLK